MLRQKASPKYRLAKRPIGVLCGLAYVREAAQASISNYSEFCIDSYAPVKLVLDVPYGFALTNLEGRIESQSKFIVVTWNPCNEYVEDLWDQGPEALLTGTIVHWQDFAGTISEAFERISYGERFRLTHGPSTPLTRRERLVLRHVAAGWDNKRVARRLHIEEQTVKNTLRSVYRKLAIRNHTQAALHYWGQLP